MPAHVAHSALLPQLPWYLHCCCITHCGCQSSAPTRCRYLAYNNLTGAVPSSWLQLPSLELVQVQPGNSQLCTGSLPESAQFDLCPVGYVICSAESLTPDGPQCSASSSGGSGSFPVAAVAVPVAVVAAAALVAAAFFVVRRRRRAAVASAAASSKADGQRFATAQELHQVCAASGLPSAAIHASWPSRGAGLGWRAVLAVPLPTVAACHQLRIPARVLQQCQSALSPTCFPFPQDLEEGMRFGGEVLVKSQPSPPSSAPPVFGSLPSSMGSKHDPAASSSSGHLPHQASGSSGSAMLPTQSSLLDILLDWHIDSNGGWARRCVAAWAGRWCADGW